MTNFHRFEASRVLVTGGAGVLGSSLVNELVGNGFNVTVLDSLKTGSLENLPRTEEQNGALRFICADLCDPSEYAERISDCDAVFHLATLRKWPERDDYDAFRGLLKALAEVRVKFLLLHSSVLVYGNASIVPTPETYGPLNPKMAYEFNKLQCENSVFEFASRRKIPAAILRFANIVSGDSYHGVVRDYFERLLLDPSKLSGAGRWTAEKILRACGRLYAGYRLGR